MYDDYFDHPLLTLRNPTDTGIKQCRNVVKCSKSLVPKHKRSAHRKNRRLVRLALRGAKIKAKQRPGDSWELY